MKPLIGLNTSQMEMDDPLRAKAVCHLCYLDAVVAGGGTPIIVPPYTEPEMLDRVLAGLDGFLLIGGPDYLPDCYGGHAQPAEELVHPRRQRFDWHLAEALLKRSQKPVLGICGGQQLISLALGGALVQDLATEWTPPPGAAATLPHSRTAREGTPEAGDRYRHEVRIMPASHLAQVVGRQPLHANSFHHQAVRPGRIGEGLIPTAFSADGVIEALEYEHPAGRFMIGVQWHPEREIREPRNLALFRALVSACNR